MEILVKGLLKELGENSDREGLVKTPERYSKTLRFLTSGYNANIGEIVGDAIYEVSSSEIVIVRDIELFSLCEHHLLPFYGKAHIAYIPNGRVVGLSKLPRIVDAFARRLQIQERLTGQITEAIQEVLQPEGVACIVEANHLCMMMRGVQKQESKTVTSSMLGAFLKNPSTRNELMHLLSGAR